MHYLFLSIFVQDKLFYSWSSWFLNKNFNHHLEIGLLYFHSISPKQILHMKFLSLSLFNISQFHFVNIKLFSVICLLIQISLNLKNVHELVLPLCKFYQIQFSQMQKCTHFVHLMLFIRKVLFLQIFQIEIVMAETLDQSCVNFYDIFILDLWTQ